MSEHNFTIASLLFKTILICSIRWLSHISCFLSFAYCVRLKCVPWFRLLSMDTLSLCLSSSTFILVSLNSSGIFCFFLFAKYFPAFWLFFMIFIFSPFFCFVWSASNFPHLQSRMYSFSFLYFPIFNFHSICRTYNESRNRLLWCQSCIVCIVCVGVCLYLCAYRTASIRKSPFSLSHLHLLLAVILYYFYLHHAILSITENNWPYILIKLNICAVYFDVRSSLIHTHTHRNTLTSSPAVAVLFTPIKSFMATNNGFVHNKLWLCHLNISYIYERTYLHGLLTWMNEFSNTQSNTG